MRELLGAGWAAVFLPGEPARLGRLLLWKPTGAAPRDSMAPTGLETETVELVLPHGRSVRRRRVEGYALSVAVAVSALANAEPTHPSGAAWQAATRLALRLLTDAAPDQLRLTDDEAFDLLGDATDALRAAGVDVHWPRDLVKALTATAEIGQRTAPGSTAGGLLDTEALLDFRWQISLGGEPLTALKQICTIPPSI